MCMDKNIIRENATNLWRLMNTSYKCYWKYSELKEKMKLDDRELFTAIGWLARENNIEIEYDLQIGEERYF